MWLSLIVWVLSQILVYTIYFWFRRNSVGYESCNIQTCEHTIPIHLVENYDQIRVSIKTRQQRGFDNSFIIDPFNYGDRVVSLKLNGEQINYRIKRTVSATSITGSMYRTEYSGFCFELSPKNLTNIYTDIRVRYESNKEHYLLHTILVSLCILVHISIY